MVVDLVPTEGSPGCRLSELLAWCSDHECGPDLDHRVLVSLDDVLARTPPDKPEMLVARMREELDGTVIFTDAPEVLGMLRVTIIASPCEEIGDDARFSCADVVGCIYSCPISIGSFSGEVVLDLDSIDETTCLRDIRVCAGDHMFDRDEVMSPCDTDAFMP